MHHCFPVPGARCRSPAAEPRLVRGALSFRSFEPKAQGRGFRRPCCSPLPGRNAFSVRSSRPPLQTSALAACRRGVRRSARRRVRAPATCGGRRVQGRGGEDAMELDFRTEAKALDHVARNGWALKLVPEAMRSRRFALCPAGTTAMPSGMCRTRRSRRESSGGRQSPASCSGHLTGKGKSSGLPCCSAGKFPGAERSVVLTAASR